MTELDRRKQELDPMIPFVMGAWHNWGSPVGLGLFFVLIAAAVDLVRLAFK
ncbi:MAG TPA: hypothetical protein VLR46_07240 [Candidatus Dormibacteraeota bacterium]|nr:hypothetical protein [Candidatus Dormibacteraeota bacterium]